MKKILLFLLLIPAMVYSQEAKVMNIDPGWGIIGIINIDPSSANGIVDTLFFAYDSIYVTASGDSLQLISDTVYISGDLIVAGDVTIDDLIADSIDANYIDTDTLLVNNLATMNLLVVDSVDVYYLIADSVDADYIDVDTLLVNGLATFNIVIIDSVDANYIDTDTLLVNDLATLNLLIVDSIDANYTDTDTLLVNNLATFNLLIADSIDVAYLVADSTDADYIDVDTLLVNNLATFNIVVIDSIDVNYLDVDTLVVNNNALIGDTLFFAYDSTYIVDATDSLRFVVDDGEVLRLVDVAGVGQALFDDGAAATPSIGFISEPALGFYREGTNNIMIVDDGGNKFRISTSGTPSFAAAHNNGFSLQNASSTSTAPTLIPDRSDLNTGLGDAGADSLSLIAGGVEGIRVAEGAGKIRTTLTDTTIIEEGLIITNLASDNLVVLSPTSTGIVDTTETTDLASEDFTVTGLWTFDNVVIDSADIDTADVTYLYVDDIEFENGAIIENSETDTLTFTETVVKIEGNVYIEGDVMEIVSSGHAIIRAKGAEQSSIYLFENDTSARIWRNDYLLQFRNYLSGDAHAVIDTSGYFGICNVTPTQELEVGGDVLINDTLFFANGATVNNEQTDTLTLTETVVKIDGGLYITGNTIHATHVEGLVYLSASGTQTITTGGTFELLNEGTMDYDSAHLDQFTSSNGRLTYTGAPTAHVTITCNLTVESGEAGGQTCQFRIAKNGTTIAATNMARDFTAINRYSAIGLNWLDEVSTNDYFEIYGTSDTNGDVFDIDNLMFTIVGH